MARKLHIFREKDESTDTKQKVILKVHNQNLWIC